MSAWRVRLTPADPGRVFTADRAEVLPGGALILRDGDPLSPVMVRGYAVGGWHSVEPEPQPQPGPVPAEEAPRDA